ncbi:Protein of unknown function [Nocardioides terrae]|uniref:DUF4235 domain-containing protein n=1 Tax=Nocardioides terrae TaxID=574651 RepID=A0A1I1FMY8_9ACTN|nr:DUF4235 domain-containing protein [Nocardioides terrae]SFC00694.1 Protein of unknown function [Nocardioides terrae]
MAKNKGSKGSKTWTIFSTVAALGAAALARKALDKGWQVSTRRRPPENPADPDVQLWEAVAWSAATGAAVAIARMFAQRRAANYYVKSAGHLPPQLAKD